MEQYPKLPRNRQTHPLTLTHRLCSCRQVCSVFKKYFPGVLLSIFNVKLEFWAFFQNHADRSWKSQTSLSWSDYLRAVKRTFHANYADIWTGSASKLEVSFPPSPKRSTSTAFNLGDYRRKQYEYQSCDIFLPNHEQGELIRQWV